MATMKPSWLIENEHIVVRTLNVSLIRPHPLQPRRGELFITNYRLAFHSITTNSSNAAVVVNNNNNNGNNGGNSSSFAFAFVAIMSIGKVDLVPLLTETRAVMDVHSKEFKHIRLLFEGMKAEEIRMRIFEQLEKIRLAPVTSMFCFKLGVSSSNDGDAILGEDQFYIMSLQKEYERMGISSSSSSSSSSSLQNGWRISHVNDNYQLCDSYPHLLVVPESISDEELINAASFRSNKRLPVLCWKHRARKPCIIRCSQPLTGIFLSSNECDKKLIKAMFALNDSNNYGNNNLSNNNFNNSNHQKPKINYIIDARPIANAVGNSIIGAGYENEKDYCNLANGQECKLVFANIENIHAVRKSAEKLYHLLHTSNYSATDASDDKCFFSDLENTQWLHHISAILQSASKIVDYISKNSTVIIHCSDGWDRTSQLSALAQLLLDPYFRTIEGFCILVEKEFLLFGHRFAERCGHGHENARKANNAQMGPIFLQFLDCVFQLLCQFPCAFEFNDKLLISFATNCYSCRFGNFLFDNDKERRRASLQQRTISMWSHVKKNDSQFINPLMTASTLHRFNVNSVLSPYHSIRNLRLWEYYRSKDSLHPYPMAREDILTRSQTLVSEIDSLQRQLKYYKSLVKAKDSNADLDLEAEDGNDNNYLNSTATVNGNRRNGNGNTGLFDNDDESGDDDGNNDNDNGNEDGDTKRPNSHTRLAISSLPSSGSLFPDSPTLRRRDANNEHQQMPEERKIISSSNNPFDTPALTGERTIISSLLTKPSSSSSSSSSSSQKKLEIESDDYLPLAGNEAGNHDNGNSRETDPLDFSHHHNNNNNNNNNNNSNNNNSDNDKLNSMNSFPDTKTIVFN